MTTEIVIIGASGFIGKSLMMQLQKNNFSVKGFSRKNVKGLTTVASYADMPVFDGAILVHLAQNPNISDSFNNEDIDLCRMLLNRNWRHIIYASSAMVYGDLKDNFHNPEESVVAFNDYSRVKLTCEEMISKVGGTSLRFANLYGPGMNINTVLSDILRQIPGTGPLELLDISPIRDFLWIEDAIRCLISACKIMPGTILNVGSGVGISVGKLANLALALANQSSRPVVAKASYSRISCLMLDIVKTKSLLNWSPEIDISEGLLYLLNKKNG